jgi:hypothetical protein
MIKRLTSFLIGTAIMIAPLPALSAEIGPLASGGAAGVHQAQAGGDPPPLWLVGAGATVALGALMLMNNKGGAIVSGTLAPGASSNAPALGQGSSTPGLMDGGNGQSGIGIGQSIGGTGPMNGGNQGRFGGGASSSLFLSNGAFAELLLSNVTVTTTTTGTQ